MSAQHPLPTVRKVSAFAAAPIELETKLPAAKYELLSELDRGWGRARFVVVRSRRSIRDPEPVPFALTNDVVLGGLLRLAERGP